MKPILIQLILSVSFNLFAASLDGISMPDKLFVEDKELVLNGLGTRKATWLKVKVYVGGLYLPQKAQSLDSILKLSGPKFIRMKFVRSVSKDQVVDGWNEAFINSFGSDHPYKSELKKLNELMQDLEKGEEMSFVFLRDKLKVSVKAKEDVIISSQISSALLSIWFLNAKDTGLKHGLLGKM